MRCEHRLAHGRGRRDRAALCPALGAHLREGPGQGPLGQGSQGDAGPETHGMSAPIGETRDVEPREDQIRETVLTLPGGLKGFREQGSSSSGLPPGPRRVSPSGFQLSIQSFLTAESGVGFLRILT